MISLKIKPTIFIHCGCVNTGNHKIILKEFKEYIKNSGKENDVDIILCTVGNKIEKQFWVKESYHEDNFTHGEFFTLGKLKEFCISISEYGIKIPVGYVHTKGVVNGFDNPCISDWRNYMAYFILEKMNDCITAVQNEYDAAGVDWVNEPNIHFSGNFWWSNSDYIKNLPEINPPNFTIKNCPTSRHLAEFWIGHNTPKVKCFHNTEINVYERHLHRYETNKYQQQ